MLLLKMQVLDPVAKLPDSRWKDKKLSLWAICTPAKNIIIYNKLGARLISFDYFEQSFTYPDPDSSYVDFDLNRKLKRKVIRI